MPSTVTPLPATSDSASVQPIQWLCGWPALRQVGLLIAISATLVFLSPPSLGQDFSGVWRGRWTTDATAKRAEHGGPLRMKLTPSGPSTYQGRFSGRFAKVIPYFYRAEVQQVGSSLYSTKKLGPLGEYRMAMQLCPNCDLSGRWNAGEHNGSLKLNHVR